jgi:hypothetical protein
MLCHSRTQGLRGRHKTIRKGIWKRSIGQFEAALEDKLRLRQGDHHHQSSASWLDVVPPDRYFTMHWYACSRCFWIRGAEKSGTSG